MGLQASKAEQSILDWLGGQRDAMLALLQTLVNTDSGSYDKPGVDAVGGHIRAFLDQHGIASEVTAGETFGDAISATVGQDSPPFGNRPILLMGHRDTVFPKGEPTRRPFKIEGDRAYGPGVADMKAGLVMNCFVLAAIKKFGGAPAPVVGAVHRRRGDRLAVLRGRSSRQHARAARVVLQLRAWPARRRAVTGRKGCLFIRFEITGKAAHSGAKLRGMGISAINELAHKSPGAAWPERSAEGTRSMSASFPAGRPSTPSRPGPRARSICASSRRRSATPPWPRSRRSWRRSYVPGTSAKIEIAGEFVPLVETPDGKALYEHYAAALKQLGVAETTALFTGGCADFGFASAAGTPTICAVGPVGGRAHSPEEYLEIDTLTPRAQALALAVLRLP